MNIKKIRQRRQRRTLRVRGALTSAISSKMRVSVFRSLNHIYAQIIDDKTQQTLASSSSLKIAKGSMDKKAVAKSVGIDLAKKALEAKLDNICFDRGPYLYHGRVKSLAEGLREGGLKI